MTECEARPLVFDIKRYAIHDGPGIRTTVFMKGCPLRCAWCHNPESWSGQPQLTYRWSKCIGCGGCVEVCPQRALALTEEGVAPVAGAGCLLCGRCADECPTTALALCGREWAMEELLAEVEKERDVMLDSGGGVTLCGGEPLMHPPALLPLLAELGRRGFHRAVDTSLYAPPQVVRAVAARCELFLVDLKHLDPGLHRRYTGVPNGLILDNVRMLAETGADFVVRVPLVAGVNADDVNLAQTARFLDSLPWKRRAVDLLPYHDMGRDKHRRIWSEYNPENFSFATPTDAELRRAAGVFARHGIAASVGG